MPLAVLLLALSAAQQPPDAPFPVWIAPASEEEERVTEIIRDELEGKRDWFVLAESPEAAELNLRITDFRIDRSTRTVRYGYLDRAGMGMTEEDRLYESWRVVGAVSAFGEVTPIIGTDGPRDANRMSLEGVAGEFVRELQDFCRDRVR